MVFGVQNPKNTYNGASCCINSIPDNRARSFDGHNRDIQSARRLRTKFHFVGRGPVQRTDVAIPALLPP